jgi:dipeptidase D
MEQYAALVSLVGAEEADIIDYPGWQPNINSPLLSLCKTIFKDMYNKDPKITAIHAGLECGVVGYKYPGMDMISYGPILHDVHSPNEKLHIKSSQNFWKFIAKTLEALAKE